MSGGSRSHILVLPYWCEKEIGNFLQILGRWDELCRTDVPYSFLVAKRHDVPESKALVEACRERTETRTISGSRTTRTRT